MKRTEIKEWARGKGIAYETARYRAKTGKIRTEKGFKTIERRIKTTFVLE